MAKTQPAVKRARKRASARPDELEAVIEDQAARKSGPDRRKSWSLLDMCSLHCANQRQRDALKAWKSGDALALTGYAGTGKTFLGSYFACSSILDKESEQDHIIIVRSAVQGREIGFTPGTVEEKLQEYEEPYQEAMATIFGREATYADMKEAKKIVFKSTSFLRGVTWDNAVILVDEAQNMTFHEINSVMTRVGKGSRIIVSGDTRQCDLSIRSRESSGLADFANIMAVIGGCTSIDFQKEDVVRSKFVKDWIFAAEDYFTKKAA